MVRKKGVKKVVKKTIRKVSKKLVKKVVKKPVKKVLKKPIEFKPVNPTKRKINLILKNLAVFVILFFLSLVLYQASGEEIYLNLFLLLSIMFGFISIAFVIVFLIFLFLKWAKK